MTEKQLPDSIVTAKARTARIREESNRLEAEAALAEESRIARQNEDKRKAREDEDRWIKSMELVSSKETMENLHERIRKMREEVPENIQDRLRAPHITEKMQAQIDLECEAGRRAVARAQAQLDANRAARAKMEAIEREREGQMSPVHVPNPRQDEKFPVNKATIK